MSRNQVPDMYRKSCGCLYDHSWDVGGPGCGPSGWEIDEHPAYPCETHKAAEMERRTKVNEKLRREKEERDKRELQRLEEEAAAVEEKARADRARIAKRRYELEHGVDRTQLEAALAKAQQDVARLTAQLDKLPPMPTH